MLLYIDKVKKGSDLKWEMKKKVWQKRVSTGIHGHMVKAQNEIKESLKLIDIVVEVLDARIPMSSRNPLIDKLANSKERIIVLNKADLADQEITSKWKQYFVSKNMICIENISTNPSSIKKLVEVIKKQGEKVYANKSKNLKINIKPIYRVLVIGIPNVGKSTIINKISGKNSANVGNKPGVTKKKQWIRVSSNIDLLDTPGLLWPDLSDKNVGVNLALTGNIKQEVLDVEELACIGIELLLNNEKYKKLLKEKYSLLENDLENISYDILEVIGKKRGCIVSGGKVDMTKSAKCFLEDLKSGKIGKITLDDINLYE